MVVSIAVDTTLNIIWSQIAEHVIVLTNFHVNNATICVDTPLERDTMAPLGQVHGLLWSSIPGRGELESNVEE